MATAMAAAVRKFQCLRIQTHPQQRQVMSLTTTTSTTLCGSSSSSSRGFSSLLFPTLSSSTAVSNFLSTTTSTNSESYAFPNSSTTTKTATSRKMMVCKFSSFRPPPAPPHTLGKSKQQSRTGNFPQPRTPSPPGSGPPQQPPPRLQRPSSLSDDRPPPKLRNHAVSLFHGDYNDYKDADSRYADEFDSDHVLDDEDDYGDSLIEGDEMSYSDRWMIRSAKLEHLRKMEEKKRWMENAKPKVFAQTIDRQGRAYGRGGRKTAHARVWIQPGLGNMVINRQDFVEYFTRDSDRENILMPLVVTGTIGAFDVQAYVYGGGTTGQAGAVRHGLARALQAYNPTLYRPIMKPFGFMTRDPRQVERKKVGRLKARKKPTWNRR